MDQNREQKELPKKKESLKLRHFSRQIALQNLYQIDLQGKKTILADSITKEFLEENSCLEESSQYKKLEIEMENFDIWEYALVLVKGCLEHWEEINQKISSLAKNWALERMAIVDRCILRIATYELCYRKDIPTSVAINEGVELGKNFSTVQSGSFINGILDNLVKKENQKANNSLDQNSKKL